MQFLISVCSDFRLEIIKCRDFLICNHFSNFAMGLVFIFLEGQCKCHTHLAIMLFLHFITRHLINMRTGPAVSISDWSRACLHMDLLVFVSYQRPVAKSL